MPSGASAQLSLASTGAGGRPMRLTRAFKILTEAASDILDIDAQATVGVRVGDTHPLFGACVCESVDIKPDGESRLAWIVTASYTSSDVSLEYGSAADNTPDPRTQSPEARYANWTMSTTTIEVPNWYWKKQGGAGWELAVNPAGDLYDGITMLQPIVNITIEQFVTRDQAYFAQYVGQVNSNSGKLGSLNLFPHSVLFRGLNSKPHTEQRGNSTWRGWQATFEFSYKPNWNGYLSENIGWDIAVPITGFNCKNTGLKNPDVEQGALTLELTDDTLGVIKGWPNDHKLNPGQANEKVRANVLISAPGAKASQRPSAQPIPLNLDGSPRSSKIAVGANDARGDGRGPVLIQRACTYNEFDMALLGLRFRS